MNDLKLHVPTYNGRYFAEEVESGRMPEYGVPKLPILIRAAEGIRIVLGTDDYFDKDAPDVQIERQPNGWVLFLHPTSGCDPCGYVYMLDDGRSFLEKESGLGPTEVIKVLEPGDELPEIDGQDSRRPRH
jgi:hypothetical protein